MLLSFLFLASHLAVDLYLIDTGPPLPHIDVAFSRGSEGLIWPECMVVGERHAAAGAIHERLRAVAGSVGL